ncbi:MULTISPECIES: hypothetical protein [Parvimonas]|jgi:hypothetical protein|uniref:Uncharacterized protein n=2 Tax=Parvimonas micra TaxID=33033 RepID=A0A9X3HAN2_9FIRM|nr:MULTISPECIES: hypothetical protein [Parvimonas]MCZ7407855.1 hypothetical protein [Parvimonas micra]MCZ7410487.1 hypothetical protein [Parvimonas micra]MCZ7412315.1 hypothetical protein [Parvimonas micra]MEB3058905.1 hypothetical protein [Parvimonas sp. D9]WBB36577.1 hypothetical protein NM218_05865 [Parvimonas micra]
MNNYEKSFTKPIIRYGSLTNLLAIPLCFIPAIYLWLVKGAFPGWNNILTGWMYVASMFAIYSVVEPICYFPILGLPGTYMSFLSGNIGNMRVPCAVVAQESLGVEPGTKKAELIATLGIAGSIFTNTIMVTIAAIGGAALMSIFPPVVLTAFKYVSSAIFGAMFAMFASKNLKYGAFALVVVMAMLLSKAIPVYIMIPIAVFSTAIFGVFDYNKKQSK